MLPQKDLLQVIPDGGLALVDVAQEQILLQYRNIVQTPLGKLCIRAAPLHKAAQTLEDGLALVQIGLGQAGDLGDMMLQFAKDAGPQTDREGVQHVGILVDLYGADLNDLAPQGLLYPVIVKGVRLVADVPLQVK